MAIFVLIFALFGVLMWTAAGTLFYFRHRQLRKTGLMRDTETTPAAGVAALTPGTTVEVKGILLCEQPLAGEMAGQECAYAPPPGHPAPGTGIWLWLRLAIFSSQSSTQHTSSPPRRRQ